ncbi:hypothetical protein SDC9_42924 [bioreactor metagenome]|uniref:Uncharacterized protein n=1 Tax=bioreactor metagenome TaxID=1076179 RepID=A0A644W1Z8_9ZZZZ
MAVAVTDQPGHKIVARGARDRVLARGIDIGNRHHIGLVEAGAEIVEEAVQARETVRLMRRNHPRARRARHILPRRLQHRGNLDRVVAVIIDDGDAAQHLAHLGEAPVDAAELRQRLADLVLLHAEVARDRNRGKAVRDVVVARHRQRAALDLRLGPLVLQKHVEMRPAFREAEVDRAHIGLGVEAEGGDAAVGDATDEGLHLGVVGAAHRHAVERDVGDKVVEALPQVLDRAPVLHVLGVDVGDDRDGRRQPVERAVRFIGLDHHPLALARPRVRTVSVDDAAVDDGRIEAALVEQRRHHRRGRGLAMGAGDRDVRLQPHQLGQHLGAAHHRQLAPARLLELGVALLDRRGDHHHRDVVGDVLGALTLVEGGAQLDQPVGDLRGLRVRALHLVAERHQHFGDARHADAADADEVDRAQFPGKFRGSAHFGCPASFSTISTSRPVASGMP